MYALIALFCLHEVLPPLMLMQGLSPARTSRLYLSGCCQEYMWFPQLLVSNACGRWNGLIIIRFRSDMSKEQLYFGSTRVALVASGEHGLAGSRQRSAVTREDGTRGDLVQGGNAKATDS